MTERSGRIGGNESGEVCPICEHRYAKARMSRHHLVPKSRGGRDTVLLCRNCHRQIHAVYTEKELEAEFTTVAGLVAAERMQSWVRWVRRRRPDGKLRVFRSADKPARWKGKSAARRRRPRR